MIDDDDLVAAAIARAKPCSAAARERYLALLAEVKDDGVWLTNEEFQRRLAAHPGAPRER